MKNIKNEIFRKKKFNTHIVTLSKNFTFFFFFLGANLKAKIKPTKNLEIVTEDFNDLAKILYFFQLTESNLSLKEGAYSILDKFFKKEQEEFLKTLNTPLNPKNKYGEKYNNYTKPIRENSQESINYLNLWNNSLTKLVSKKIFLLKKKNFFPPFTYYCGKNIMKQTLAIELIKTLYFYFWVKQLFFVSLNANYTPGK